MDCDTKAFIKKDYLAILIFLGSKIFELKIMKAVLLSIVLIHGSVNLITTYFMLYIFTIEEFINNAPVYFGYLYVSTINGWF